MSINKHLTNNINLYINQQSPEQAFLLIGDWGSGKTYFINQFIKHSQPKGKKIINISIFGMSNTSEIDAKIFEALHPILGSRYAKLTGNIIKGALSMGFKVDVSDPANKELSSELKLDKLNINDFFSIDAKKEQIVIIFDDIERSNIPYKQLLGYINHLIEVSGIHTLLVANEKAILQSKHKNLYADFKEKVICKTFEIKQDHSEIITTFLKEKKNKKLLHLQDKIEDIFLKSKSKNLRILKQVISDFDIFSQSLHKTHLNNDEFYRILVDIFFSISVEIKKGTLDEIGLRRGPVLNPTLGGEQSVTHIKETYFKDLKAPLYSAALWADIIFNSDFEHVQNATSKLAFFIQMEEKKLPDWVRLWHFEDLEFKEFMTLLKQLEREVESEITDPPDTYLHKLGLIINFCDLKFSSLDLTALTLTVKKNINTPRQIENWAKHLINADSLPNTSGLYYLSDKHPAFKELKNLISKKASNLFQQDTKRAHQKNLNTLSTKLFDSLDNENIDELTKILIESSPTTPFLQHISARIFTKHLLMAKNTTIAQLNRIIGERYTSNRMLNGSPYHFHLAEEVKFWNSVKSELGKSIKDVDPLKFHILERFKDHSLSNLITVLTMDMKQA